MPPRHPAAQQEVGDHGEGVLVGACARGLALRLLRGHERRAAGDHGQPGGDVERLAQAEVAEHRADTGLGGAVADTAEQHVGGLHVAVQDVAVVQRLQPGGDLADHLGRLGHLQPAGLEPVGEGALVGVRHHQVGAAVVELAGVVDRDHVRRLHAAQVATLLDEAGPDVVVLGPVVRQHLHRDGRVEVLVVRQPDGGETAGADATSDRIAAKTVGQGGHPCIIRDLGGEGSSA